MNTRDIVIQKIKPILVKHDKILTIWEGGSRATKRLDQYSDLDLMMVTNKEDTLSIYNFFESLLEETFGIQKVYKVKEPAWHGFSQRFYQLKNTEDYFYLDVCILHPKIKDKFTAIDRHGEAFVWKDTIHFIDPTPTPNEMVDSKAHAFYENAISSEFILYNEVNKALKRKNYLDAFTMVNGYLMRHLIPLLNIKYRKAQVDFGLRYADYYYQKEDIKMIERFFKAQTIEDLQSSFEELNKRFNQLKDTIQFD